MCGVVGYYSNKPNEEDTEILQSLIFESKIRGIHSFGITYKVDDCLFKTNKEFLVEQIRVPETNMLIGHNRYSTSGDWRTHRNNQPLEYKDNYLVFNGVIDMGTKKEIEKKFNIEMDSNNDGEIFLKNPDLILNGYDCSFAGIFIYKNKIYCYRNKERPLYRHVYKESVFLASTSDIFKRCHITDVSPIKENTKIELKELLDKDYGIQEVSYPDDGKWGYRPSVQLSALSR